MSNTTDANQASEDNIGCEYCSSEDDKPGWKGSYSDDGAIGYSVCINCNLDAKAPLSSSDGSLNKSDMDVKLDKALGYMTMVWDESSVFGQPPDYSHIHLTGKQEAKEALQALIRNEKLKLLAEVRERVIGEHKPKTRGLTQNPNNAAYWTKASKAEFDLIEQQLNNLDELEAEL